ncbi:hypothetical protein TNIN_197321, partial [Trichonephila inaurata madagascariensis]
MGGDPRDDQRPSSMFTAQGCQVHAI